MARRRNDGGVLELVTMLPWPVGVILGVGLFVYLHFILPCHTFTNPVWKVFQQIFSTPPLPLLCGGVFVAAGMISALKALMRGTLFSSRKSLASVKALSWRDFEMYIGEAYRRQGYEVEETGGGGSDGGIDLILRRGREVVLVQCKQWRNEQVGVRVAREMYGLLQAESATKVIIATSGDFTPDARAFAADKPIELLNGRSLEQMVFGAKNGLPSGAVSAQTTPPPVPAPVVATTTPPVAPACPKCGAKMVLRTAQKGSNAGNQFWGCSRYPQCRGVLSV